jgi:hypothetical protein
MENKSISADAMLTTESFAETEYEPDSEWESILKELCERYGLPEADASIDNLKLAMASAVKAIDHDFTIKKAGRNESVEKFRYLHVEMLLDQAADLLDRAIQSRAEWDELNLRRTLQDLEILEFSALDKIHEEEIKSGVYKVPYLQSDATQQAEKKSAEGYGKAVETLEHLIHSTFSGEQIERQKDLAYALAWISVYPVFTKDVAVGGEFTYGSPLNPEETGALPALLSKFSNELKTIGLNAEKASLIFQKQIQEAIRDRAQALLVGLDHRTKWDQLDEGFRLQRTSVARTLAKLKYKLANDPGGALNYKERMDSIRARCESDFQQAIKRIVPAQQGLEKLYGYTISLPPSIQSMINETTPPSRNYLDDLARWVRDAISWRVGFSQFEQSYVIPISMKKYSKNWKDGLRNLSWQFELPGNNAQELFRENERYVRLRGISVFVVEDDKDDMKGLWQAIIQPPRENSYCRHQSGEHVPLDTSFVPACRLGRVTSRNSRRDPDVVGILALHNISPYGEWSISLSNVSTLNEETVDLEDVQIDFYVAMRSV